MVKAIKAEYEPIPNKRDSQRIAQYYSEKSAEIIKEHPWNTGTCIARNIIANNDNVYDHKLDTMARYTREIVKNEYTHPAQETQWMKLSNDKLSYEPLTKEQQETLFSLFAANSKSHRAQIELEAYADYDEGYITREELANVLLDNVEKAFVDIMTTFQELYGFRPMKIRHLEKCAFQEQI
jgi:hypothetical protein